ncbi:p53-induced protein with a death domain [Mizuhopecten yessoensis]|uniref:p53-induced protein with a death domain n=1 Tax=Mizuhopecten yessoensis TaxID=6573 RepID=A0A210R4D1_MIZYE|nr:p53-induced protein with a death domain [Mizuhopecten yessoensis]
MGAIESHDFAPVRDDERKELNLSRRITYKQYKKHLDGDCHEACLSEIPWSIRDSICLYERMNVSFNAITELPPELPLRLPHLYFLDLSHNKIETLPDSFGLLFHLKTLLLKHNKLHSLPQSFVHHVKLEKIDLSHNLLKELPDGIGKMESLSKLNVSNNKLKILPVSLGNCKTLTLLLAQGNRLNEPSQCICDEGSEVTIKFLKQKYFSIHPYTDRLPCNNLNEFTRVRGNQLPSSVPNPHSAHVQYIQTQTHTTNTPSRIKSPLLPPLGASDLDAGILRDKIIGLIYGAAIGDAMGLATRSMSVDEAAFHYNSSNIQYSEIVVDDHRVRWRPGDWTSNFDLFVLVLDSVISWGGVVDELDFAKRLSHWSQKGFPELGDTEGIILSPTIQQVTCSRGYTDKPHGVSEEVYRTQCSPPQHNGSVSPTANGGTGVFGWSSDNKGDRQDKKLYVRSDSQASFSCGRCEGPGIDNGAIVRTAVLGIPSFFDLSEVVNNTTRISRATHANPRSTASCVVISVLVALMLQGRKDLSDAEKLEELIATAKETGRQILNDPEQMEEFDQYCDMDNLDSLKVTDERKMGHTYMPLSAGLISLRSNQDFRTAMMKLIMKTGDANSNACVAGALLGCKEGFSHLPKHWDVIKFAN